MMKLEFMKKMLKKTIEVSGHEINYALALKFAALGALWFFFVRGHEIVPTPALIAQHLF
jgi:hypothetical protein